jgi:predicted negative regulator of RcsB-dependent stress response
MATQLDLQEQEQVDALKAFWKQYGNLITWALVAALLVYAGINGWQWFQRDQAQKAGAMYDELDRAAQAGDVDKTARIFADLKDRYGRTAFAQQGGLLTAKVQADMGKADDARATLSWVVANGADDEIRVIARLRLAGALLDAKQPDEALKQLEGLEVGPFAALAADRRGDALMAQGKQEAAIAAYRQAFKTMEERLDYRRLVEAKLAALGAVPAKPDAAASAASAGTVGR